MDFKQKFRLSLYLLIPFVFTGLALLTVLVSLQVGRAVFQAGAPLWWLWAWGGLICLITLGVSVVVVWMFLRPLRRFLKQVAEVEAIDPGAEPAADLEQNDELASFNRMVDRFSALLDKLDARRLFPEITGQSPALRAVLHLAQRVAASNSTVLLCGETGTGKELFARAIVRLGPRHDRPLVVVNCASIPEGLLESELFGHQKGAFTGADSTVKGRFELADGGTIFLDEIGELPLHLQAKLLRVLEDGILERVGGRQPLRPLRVDLRVIAATNRDLAIMVRSGKFREDLYYRLNVFTITLPPLRARPEDIPLLVEHFLQQRKPPLRIGHAALNLLLTHPWPGNVRELKNLLERAALVADGEEIKPEHLGVGLGFEMTPSVPPSPPPRPAASPMPPPSEPFPEADRPLDETLTTVEKDLIIQALQRSGGIQVEAARLLGIKERSLYHRLRKHDIDAMALRKTCREEAETGGVKLQKM